MSKQKTEHTIILDADELYGEIEAAQGEGADSLSLEITFKMVNRKPEIIRKRLHGEITTEYDATI
jgi:hypothetical protein